MTGGPSALPPVTPGRLGADDMRRLLATDSPVILDIGANNGQTTREFLQAFPRCSIYAFEPDERALAKLRVRANDPRVRIYDFAIGAEDGEAEFHVSSGMPPGVPAEAFAKEFPQGWDMSGSLRAPKTHEQVWPWCKFDETRKIKVRRLDGWARDAGLSRIDLIWADVQGAEGDLIRGGKDTLANTRYFYTEYSNDEWYDGQPTLQALAASLDGFSIHTRYQMDVLFKNNAL